MRVLVVSTFYPPVAYGGYEVECSAVVDRLRMHHDVLVLTSDAHRDRVDSEPDVWRDLALLSQDARGSLRAPLASVRAAGVARRALAWGPDLIYSWNGSSIPQAALRVLADSGVPLAVRVCQHWFADLFVADQFQRELLPARRNLGRAVWSAGCQALNRIPALRLEPTRSLCAAISWNAETVRRMVAVPPFVDAVFESVCHSVPRYGDVYAQVVRRPAAAPEILFLGRVTDVKGLSVAIEALVLLRSSYGLTARLVVMGPEDADHGLQMRAMAQRLGVQDLISWRGQGTPDEVAAALARAHVLIVPSQWDEPFPLVTIEGAFAGVPLVASDVGGIGEGMHHEDHALLFPRGDAAAAAAALARTLNEPEQTAARAARARQRAEAEFRLEPYLAAQERFVEDAQAALRS